MNSEYLVVATGFMILIGIIACVHDAVSDKPVKKQEHT